MIRKGAPLLCIYLNWFRKKQNDKSSAGDEHAGEASSRQILPISGPSSLSSNPWC